MPLYLSGQFALAPPLRQGSFTFAFFFGSFGSTVGTSMYLRGTRSFASVRGDCEADNCISAPIKAGMGIWAHRGRLLLLELLEQFLLSRLASLGEVGGLHEALSRQGRKRRRLALAAGLHVQAQQAQEGADDNLAFFY